MVKNYWKAGFENAENVDNSEEFFRMMGMNSLKEGVCGASYNSFLLCKHLYFHMVPFSKRI